MSFIQAKPAATHDFYGPVHKGLRLAQTRMLTRLGACDGQDAQALAELIADLRALLHLAEHHLANEDLAVHTALEARAPGATARLVQSHEHHRDAFEALEALTVQVEAADAVDRPKLMRPPLPALLDLHGRGPRPHGRGGDADLADPAEPVHR